MYLRHKKRYNRNQEGYITLITVLIVGAIGSAVAISLVLMGISTSRSGLGIQQSTQARALTAACTDTALQEIRKITGFSGSGSITIGQGACQYTVTRTGGQNRTITATGTVATTIRKVQVSVTAINPKILISSWQEIP